MSRKTGPAVEWYVAVLGAEVILGPILMPDGPVGHVELAVDGARWMMSDSGRAYVRHSTCS